MSQLAVPVSERRAGRVLFAAPVVVFVAAIVFGHLPLIAVFFRQLWKTAEYQYFPFVIAAVVAFVFLRWKESPPADPARATAGWWREISLCVVGLLLLSGAVYFYNPWSAAVSIIVCVASLFLYLSRYRHVTNLWGIWCLLWLIVPLPMGGAVDLAQALQRVSSYISSELLDLIRVNHVMRGNTLHLPGKHLFVDEACSGIVSVMSVIACAAIFVVWRNRSLLHSVLLIVTGIIWAVLMNVVRIVTIAVAEARFDVDLSTGTAHEILGLSVFLVTFIAVVSSDQLFAFLLHPIEVGALWQRGVEQNPLLDRWNRFVGFLKPGQRLAEPAESEPPVVTIKRRNMRWLVLVGVSFALLGGYQFGGHLWAAATADPATIEHVNAIDSSLLPAQIGTWTKVGHRLEPPREHFPTSQIFDFQNQTGGQRLQLSIDYPFPHGWHELTDCYDAIGWQLAQRSVQPAVSQSGEDWNYVEARFDQIDEYGFLTFGFVDAYGGVLSPPAQGGLTERIVQRLRRRSPHSLNPNYFQLQAWVESPAPLDEESAEEVRSAFLQFREYVRDYIVHRPEK